MCDTSSRVKAHRRQCNTAKRPDRLPSPLHIEFPISTVALPYRSSRLRLEFLEMDMGELLSKSRSILPLACTTDTVALRCPRSNCEASATAQCTCVKGSSRHHSGSLETFASSLARVPPPQTITPSWVKRGKHLARKDRSQAHMVRLSRSNTTSWMRGAYARALYGDRGLRRCNSESVVVSRIWLMGPGTVGFHYIVPHSTPSTTARYPTTAS